MHSRKWPCSMALLMRPSVSLDSVNSMTETFRCDRDVLQSPQPMQKCAHGPNKTYLYNRDAFVDLPGGRCLTTSAGFDSGFADYFASKLLQALSLFFANMPSF